MRFSQETLDLAKRFYIANCAEQSSRRRINDPQEFFQDMAELSLDAALAFDQAVDAYQPPDVREAEEESAA